MSQVITTRNNKQSGGTYVTIKTPDSSDKFEKSEDNAINLKTLLENCHFIGCINASSANSIVFVCYLSKDGNIVLRSEREPDKTTYNFCIKVSFIRTDETPNLHSLKLQFEHSKEREVDKNIKTAYEVITEGAKQQQMFDSLQPNVLKDFIPDTIGLGNFKPDEFKEFTEQIFDKGLEGWRNPEELKKYHEKIIFTVTIIQSIIENANRHKLTLGVTFMDYFANAISFEQYVETHCSDPKSLIIDSVTDFHNTGYYKDVYKIVEIVGAYIISILEITGLWNYDLNSGNIMVNGGGGGGDGGGDGDDGGDGGGGGGDGYSDIKIIDFGYTKNLKDPDVKQEIIGIFKRVYSGIASNTNIQNFMLIPNSEQIINGHANELETVVTAFSKHYDEIITNLPSNIQTLLKPDSTDEETNIVEKRTKRKIVFKILMFLAFIDGLIQRDQPDKFDRKSFQCKDIMEFMFNCKIFVNFATFVRFSSLDYDTFLENSFKSRLPIITKLEKILRYKGLCSIILDNICSRIAGLLSESGKQRYTSSVGSSVTSSEGGKGISKKRYPRLRKSTRRPLRRKSGTKRLRRRRSNRHSRTSRK
jgi:hypothetical protein